MLYQLSYKRVRGLTELPPFFSSYESSDEARAVLYLKLPRYLLWHGRKPESDVVLRRNDLIGRGEKICLVMIDERCYHHRCMDSENEVYWEFHLASQVCHSNQSQAVSKLYPSDPNLKEDS